MAVLPKGLFIQTFVDMKRLFICSVMLSLVLGAAAVPAKRGLWKTLRLADGQETTALSPFYEANREQDKKAFCRLMECIREYDGQTGTVLAVQVENEPGMYAASIRDFSEKGTEAFQGMVPAAVIDAVRGDAGEAGDAWRENGRKENGSWAEVFGRFGAELCMAWATAEYINDIALAGESTASAKGAAVPCGLFTYRNQD